MHSSDVCGHWVQYNERLRKDTRYLQQNFGTKATYKQPSRHYLLGFLLFLLGVYFTSLLILLLSKPNIVCKANNYKTRHSILINYANPVYGVATICHQVRWLRWGHPSLFHIATSLLIWYKMFCVRDKSFRHMWMEFINMFSVYAQSGTHSRIHW